MAQSSLRAVGGSVMVTIPKSLMESLGLAVNDKVALKLNGDALEMRPVSKPKYSLEELLGQCEPDSETNPIDTDWDDARPIGREII